MKQDYLSIIIDSQQLRQLNGHSPIQVGAKTAGNIGPVAHLNFFSGQLLNILSHYRTIPYLRPEHQARWRE